MANSKNMSVYEARKHLPNMWHSDLLRTPVESPLYCCYAMWCPCLVAYQQRERVLYGDWSRYQCCGGGMPCSGSCGESKCPQLCACVEVTLCFTLAVSATRFMLQDALQIQNTKCDNCIIASMFFLQYLNCLCWIAAMVTNIPFIDDAAVVTDRIADISYCTVCACIQTQHKLELDKRDGLIQPRATIPPPQQEMSRPLGVAHYEPVEPPLQVMKNQRGSAANIWDVVSSLAQALTDARDQLVGLINSKEKGHKGCRKGKENIDTVLRARGGGGFSKPYVPNNGQVRSVHRQHARGHVAFGVHSEFKPEPAPRNCKQETMAVNWSCGRQAGNSRGVQLYLDPKSNSVQINNNNNRGGGCESPVSIIFPKSCSSPAPREPYDCKRHCIGTQCAALLREEACRARTRRLEKSCDRLHGKPRWARC